jgi:hypothetical protein
MRRRQAPSGSSFPRATGLVVIVLGLLLAAVACSDSSDTATSDTSSTTTGSSTTSTSGDTVPAFVDIVECEIVGGTGTSSGTITNQGDQPAAFALEIGFQDDSTGEVLGTGTFETDTVDPGEEVSWEVSAAGLEDVEVTCKTVSLSSGGSGATPTSGSASGAQDEEFPCTLVTQAEVSQLAGNDVEPGDVSTIHVTEDTTTWTAEECAWPSNASEYPLEVTLAVSRAADFPSGVVGCPPILGASTPVTGLGTEASWSWSDPGTTLKVGELRVCTPDALVHVRVSGATDETSLQQTAVGVAEGAIGQL